MRLFASIAVLAVCYGAFAPAQANGRSVWIVNETVPASARKVQSRPEARTVSEAPARSPRKPQAAPATRA